MLFSFQNVVLWSPLPVILCLPICAFELPFSPEYTDHSVLLQPCSSLASGAPPSWFSCPHRPLSSLLYVDTCPGLQPRPLFTLSKLPHLASWLRYLHLLVTPKCTFLAMAVSRCCGAVFTALLWRGVHTCEHWPSRHKRWPEGGIFPLMYESSCKIVVLGRGFKKILIL